MDITITLNQDEILGSICNFLRAKNVVTDDKNIEINLVAGRGANGHSAVISIKDGEPKGIDTTMASAKLTTSTEPDGAVPAPQTRRRTIAKAQPEQPAATVPPVIPEPEPFNEEPSTMVPTETLSADAMTNDLDLGENEVPDALFANGDNTSETTGLFAEPGEQPQEVESLFS